MKKLWKPIVAALVFVGLWLFWAIPGRAALNFQEQFQLFIVDWDYFVQHLTTKGGLAVYLSEALVQFYNNYWLGAAILAGELMLIGWLGWKLLSRIFVKKRDGLMFCLSFVFIILVMVEIGDVNTKHSLLIAIIEELAMAYILAAVITTKRIRRLWQRIALAVILLPLFAIIYIWTAGPDHYRSKTESFSLSNVFNPDYYELLDYDLLVRGNDWEGIIRKAEQKKPEMGMSICALNLALGMTSQLGARAGEFHQPSTEGLVAPFSRESFSTLTTAEIYFQLGLTNIAQRLYFEALQGLPNHTKSCRCLRRLAETNLVTGQYGVARKYLYLLQKTVFYQLWATKTLALIDRGEEAINAHPLYGKLRRYGLTEDTFFSEKEFDLLCGRLFLTNRNNSLALQYMLMYPLLDNDMEKFVKYMQVVDASVSFSPEAESFRKYLPKNL